MANFRPGGLQQIPMVVRNLIIINVLVFLLTQSLQLRGIDLDNYLALHYWQSPLFRWWQVFTHLFMHASLSHIFFNMFALWMFGRILENVWGPQRFLIYYLICGLGAAFCHLGVLTFEYTTFYNDFIHFQQNPTFAEYTRFITHYHLSETTSSTMWDARSSIDAINKYYYEVKINEATVGASGAVFGLLFAFGYLFPNTELLIFFIPIPVKAKYVVAGYALVELSLGVYASAGDNIAHFAHLGGMLFGFILLRIWNNKTRNRFY